MRRVTVAAVFSMAFSAAASAPALAQAEENRFTTIEFAACATLAGVIDRLAEVRDSDARYIDRNRDRNLSGSALDRYNDRVVEHNAVNDALNDLIDDFESDCAGGRVRSSTSTPVCRTRHDRLNQYVYGSSMCGDFRD